MTRILVIDDSRETRDVLEEQLRQAGYAVQSAPTGTDGLRLSRERRPDIVLLDAALPDMTPAGLCRAFEADDATRGVVVIVMLAVDQEEVYGAQGAVDSIGKPFSVRELFALIDQTLRRRRPEVNVTRPIDFGLLHADRETQTVAISGVEVILTPLEYKLLITLYDRRDQVQSRDTLLCDVWMVSADITTRTVDTHVKRLRSKLGDAAHYIQTVRGIGYRFAASPEEHEVTDF